MRFGVRTAFVHKFVAAVLLLWTVADLSVPGFCQSGDDEAQDVQSIPYPKNTTWNGQHSESRAQVCAAPDSGQQKAPVSPEDCFCCCAHIAPTPHFHLSAMPRSAQLVTLYRLDSITAFVSPLYHPPRS